MKKLIIISLVALAAISCNNEKTGYKDYDYQTLYFPVQYPVRTLSLGNDLVDNSLDKAHKFNIGACVGGYYDHNKRDWRVDFVVDESLVPENYLMNDNGDFLEPMPVEYYTINPSAQVTIRKGSFNGLIEVQLADAFFTDPRAVKGCLVIPVRITGSPDTENILYGTPAPGAPMPADPHVASQWDVAPMDYTLFGVKYVNPWHGKWLRRGQLTVRDAAGDVVETKVYRNKYVEFSEVVTLTTTSMSGIASTMSIAAETFKLKMEVDGDNNISVTSDETSPVTVTYGSGLYKENDDEWGGTPEEATKRDAIYLNYFYKRKTGGVTYNCEVTDTLVFRDRAIKYEATRPTPVN